MCLVFVWKEGGVIFGAGVQDGVRYAASLREGVCARQLDPRTQLPSV